MKVVLFCGGQGMRLREYSSAIPKPMVDIGYRPILWHVMKYYAHFGHKDFILCLGWKANIIKQYFLNYNECESNDFVLSGGGDQVELLNSDIDDWRVTFVDTGTTACVGQRLRAVRPHLEGESTFLANYTDSLTNLPLPDLIDFHFEQATTASFVAVRPPQSFHQVMMDDTGHVQTIQAVSESEVWMNAGCFVLQQEIFDVLQEGEDLVQEPFQRLVASRQVRCLKYEGFYGCMDTFKEKQRLDDMYNRGDTPWEVWKSDVATDCRPMLRSAAEHELRDVGATKAIFDVFPRAVPGTSLADE